MRSRGKTYARLVALAVLLAVGVSLLHRHPAWHDAEKLASCPAAGWHAGAILNGAPAPALLVALVVQAAPADLPVAVRRAPAPLPWSSRAPPLV